MMKNNGIFALLLATGTYKRVLSHQSLDAATFLERDTTRMKARSPIATMYAAIQKKVFCR